MTGHSAENIGIPYKRAHALSSYALAYVALMEEAVFFDITQNNMNMQDGRWFEY